jgi:hypothetical protein
MPVYFGLLDLSKKKLWPFGACDGRTHMLGAMVFSLTNHDKMYSYLRPYYYIVYEIPR